MTEDILTIEELDSLFKGIEQNAVPVNNGITSGDDALELLPLPISEDTETSHINSLRFGHLVNLETAISNVEFHPKFRVLAFVALHNMYSYYKEDESRNLEVNHDMMQQTIYDLKYLLSSVKVDLEDEYTNKIILNILEISFVFGEQDNDIEYNFVRSASVNSYTKGEIRISDRLRDPNVLLDSILKSYDQTNIKKKP